MLNCPQLAGVPLVYLLPNKQSQSHFLHDLISNLQDYYELNTEVYIKEKRSVSTAILSHSNGRVDVIDVLNVVNIKFLFTF